MSNIQGLKGQSETEMERGREGGTRQGERKQLLIELSSLLAAQDVSKQQGESDGVSIRPLNTSVLTGSRASKSFALISSQEEVS